MTIETGGPAFPCGLQSGHLQPLHDGMTLRDYFAAKAMQGLLSDSATIFANHEYAGLAYQMADAMLAARKGGAA